MASDITNETIDYVAALARLELTGQERDEARRDMCRMLDYIDKLNELDTAGVEPMSHVFPLTNVFREDEVTEGDGRRDTLQNAPEVRKDMFVAPRTFVKDLQTFQ